MQINPAGGRRGFGCCGGGIGLKKGENIRLRNSYEQVEGTNSKIEAMKHKVKEKRQGVREQGVRG